MAKIEDTQHLKVGNKLPSTCFCGATFGNQHVLHAHAKQHGHLLLCVCGIVVASEQALLNHDRDVKHSPNTSGFRLDLCAAPNSAHTCAVCGYHNLHAVPLQHHILDKHNGCPTCGQVFESETQRLRHQKAPRHCYCAVHGQAFSGVAAFSRQMRLDGHNDGFECLDCARNFATQLAFDHHMDSDGHKKVVAQASIKVEEISAAAKLEEANLRCEPCDRKFCNLKALFKAHNASIKHNPLSDLKCPLSDHCSATFTSPSALLFHLESGGCKSGMNRVKLNAIMFKHDTNSRITVASQTSSVLKAAASKVSQSSIHPRSSASQHVPSLLAASKSSVDGSVLTPDESDDTSTIGRGSIVSLEEDDVDYTGSELQAFSALSFNDTFSTACGGGAMLTPSASTVSSCGGAPVSTSSSDSGVNLTPTASLASKALSSWSHVFSSINFTPAATSLDSSSTDTIRYDGRKQRWICPICSDAFRKKRGLLQHMKSPRHAVKIFHCPTGLPGLSPSNKPTLQFKTASGLAQHIEAGSCHGGQQMLGFIAGLIETQIAEALGKKVKLLKE